MKTKVKKVNVTPSVRGAVYDDPELQIGLSMSLGFARLLHEILKESGGGAAIIDDCLTQAIQVVESKQSSAFRQKEEPSAA